VKAAFAPPSSPASIRQRRILIAVLAVIVLLLAYRVVFTHRDNAFEKIAGNVTLALQNDDVAGVQSYQNAETATYVTRARVGRGSDVLLPLGKLKDVKQTSADTDTRRYTFELTFDHGTLTERIKFDPDNKIVSFAYDAPILNP